MPIIKQRRPYTGIYFPSRVSDIDGEDGLRKAIDDLYRRTEQLSYEIKKRDLAQVSSDDARLRYLVNPDLEDDFMDGVLDGNKWVTTGSASVQDEKNGIVQIFTTGSGTTESLMDRTSAFDITDVSQNPVVSFRIKPLQSTQQTIRAGLKIAQATVAPTTNFIVVQNDPGAGAANWLGAIDNAGATTTVDLGIAVSTTAYEIFYVVVNGSKNTVQFYSGDPAVFRGSISATLNTGGMHQNISIKEKEPVVKYLNVDYFRAWFTR